MGKGKRTKKELAKAAKKGRILRRAVKPRGQAPPLGQGIFTVTNADLDRLTPEHAVDLIRELLWAEARRSGFPTTMVNITAWIDVPDGGIDAMIDADIIQGSFLRPGRTGLQIKAGAGFQPWTDSHMRKELFGQKKPGRDNLGPSVRACLDGNGTYVLVCAGCDLPEKQRQEVVALIKKYFSICGYKSAKVEVWSQNTLSGLLQPFPSLRLKVNGRERSRFQTHKNWSQQDDMKKPFKAGTSQTEFISSLQKELRRTDEAVHVRVVGEPGVGKSKLAFEGTGAEDLAPLVLYCDNAAKFRDSELMNELLKEDNNFASVLVIDECDEDARSYIWNKMKQLGPRIKLVSIYNERDETAGSIVYLDAPPLGREEIGAILSEYGVASERTDRWAEFCSGSPRVAHVIGWNLRNNPEDLLKSPDTVNVWGRYIVGGDDAQSARVDQRRQVLRYLALFKRFGYGPKVAVEAEVIASIVQAANPRITRARFQELIKELQKRRILQGENTLYITPKALHIKLWSDWWDIYGHGLDVQNFTQQLAGKLPEWFYDMFRYAAESEAAVGVVNQLLGETGPFQAGSYLEDPSGAHLFLALTEANPQAALECLQHTVGTWSRERLLTFTTGRREVVWALERIAVWRDFFSRAATLLLQLAEAETETIANNATGIFVGLFSPGPGAVAPTEASPEERFSVLKGAFDSDSKERRVLALNAADAALEATHFSRVSGAEHQGLRKEPELWTPATYGEMFDAYRRVWRLVAERLDDLPGDERAKASGVLLSRARGLARYQNLFDMVVSTVADVAAKSYADRKKIIETIERILHYDSKKIPDGARTRWQQLKQSMIGDDFHSLMERYVGMDLLEDRFDGEGKETDKAEPRINQLAAQAATQPGLLEPELPWLVTEAAKNGYRFGYALGIKDETFALLPKLLNTLRGAGRNGNAFFVGGYFRVLREQDTERWELVLDELSRDDKLRGFVPELTWRSGLTDRAAHRLLDLAKKGAIDVASFQMFGYGSVVADLDEAIFRLWIRFLLANGSREAVAIGLDLHDFYYLREDSKRKLPRVLTLELLTAPSLFRKAESRHGSQMEEHNWTEIGKRFVRTYPQDSLELAEQILAHFGEDGTVVESFHPSALSVLDAVAEQQPGKVWKSVAKYLGPPIDARAYRIAHWLRGDDFFPSGEKGVLPLIPLDDIWQWVEEDIEKRAWYLASFVPKQLFRREGDVCLAREVLIRYGNRKDVRSNLIANFSSEGWTGPESIHYMARRQLLLDFRKDEPDANVRRWIDEYVASLNRSIERARVEEEREH